MDYSKPIPVIGKDGARGTLVDVPSEQRDTSHALVQFETGQRVLVPTDALTLQADGSYYYLALRQEELTNGRTIRTESADDPLVLPVIVEQLQIQKQLRVTGRVRISKAVHEREQIVDEPLLRRTVEVERVPINRVVEGDIPVRYEGDTMIIPVLEEVLVVEKRLMLKEELHIKRYQEEIHQPQRIVLHSEDITVERTNSNTQLADSRAEPA